MRLRQLTVAGVIAGLTASAAAAAPQISVDQLECIPLARHSVVEADVSGHQAGETARVYFRRLNEEVEDFYWVEMQPRDGRYWAPLPKPEDYRLDRHTLDEDADAEPEQLDSEWRWAAWWKAKELSDHRDPNGDLDSRLIEERAQVGKAKTRDWMLALSDQELESWLEDLEFEPAEYYVAVVDSFGKVVDASDTLVTPVRRDCDVRLDPVQAGGANNITVGETAPWQEGLKVFHWLCDGLVTRINSVGVPRADEVCRACVVAFFRQREFLLPAIAGIGGITTIIIDEPPNPSPSLP